MAAGGRCAGSFLSANLDLVWVWFYKDVAPNPETVAHQKNFMKRLIIVLAFILSVSSVFALELKSDDLNFIITIPGTWTITSQDSTGFYIKSQDGKRAVSLVASSAPFAKFDSNYIANYEQVLQKTHHVQLVSSKIFTIDGAPAYENIQRLGEGSIASVQVEHQIFADGRLYMFSTVVFGGDATQDSEMQQGLASFHFLHPPKISAGRFGFLGVKLTVVGIIIAGIIFWVIRSQRT